MAHDSSDRAFDELQDILQQAILTEYPNPERKGCPGTAVIRELTLRPKPIRDEAWHHVTHCSPCYREFLDQRVEVIQRGRAARKSRLRLILATAATLLIIVAVATYSLGFRTSSGGASSRAQFRPALLDLRPQSIVRGDQTIKPKLPPPVLPAERLDLTIDLPIGYEPGQYELRLTTATDQPLTTADGTAVVRDGVTILQTRLDLSGLRSGRYLIGIRAPSSEWANYQIVLR